jgi:hypothetical protein
MWVMSLRLFSLCSAFSSIRLPFSVNNFLLQRTWNEKKREKEIH